MDRSPSAQEHFQQAHSIGRPAGPGHRKHEIVGSHGSIKELRGQVSGTRVPRQGQGTTSPVPIKLARPTGRDIVASGAAVSDIGEMAGGGGGGGWGRDQGVGARVLWGGGVFGWGSLR